MSHITIKSSPIKDLSKFEEMIRVTPNRFTGNLINFSGEQGEFWVSLIPSLNVSGYGRTEEEAKQDLYINVNTFCEDLFEIDADQRRIELSKLGWTSNNYFRKRFSKAFVDEDGVLQSFDHPEKVKKSILEAA